MKEYAIYCRIKRGKPYIIDNNTNKHLIIDKLYDIINWSEKYNETYFVDNDFFHNIYAQLSADKYYCIKEREITEWQTYSEDREIKNEDSKIIFFRNFAK